MGCINFDANFKVLFFATLFKLKYFEVAETKWTLEVVLTFKKDTSCVV